MLKQIIEMFYNESRNCITKEELNGYYYASYDMLFIMVCNNVISQCAYEYLLKKMEKIKSILMFQKFNDVNYLFRLEESGRL